MYMEDERSYKPTTNATNATNAKNSRVQDMQTDKSYMKDHWNIGQTKRSDPDPLAKPSQTEASYLREHHTPSQSLQSLGAKTSQTETSYIHDKYILDRERIKTSDQEPSQTQLHTMDRFHYPTQFQCPTTSRGDGVCPCRSQATIITKKKKPPPPPPPTLSCQTDYPAESIKTAKSQTSVPTCSSYMSGRVDATTSTFKTPTCATSQSQLPSCKANTDINPCGISSEEKPCGLPNFPCSHPLFKDQSKTSHISSDHDLLPPYNQPSFGYEEQTSCTTRSRSVVDKITCLCSSSHHPKQASCGLCDEKRSVSERTVMRACPPKPPVSACSQIPRPTTKSVSKRVSLPNNAQSVAGDTYCDCDSSSSSAHMAGQKSDPIVTSCYASKEPSVKTTFKSSATCLGSKKSEPIKTSSSCVPSGLMQQDSKRIVTSCYTSKEPSMKTAFRGNSCASCVCSKATKDPSAKTADSELTQQDSETIVTSCYTSKEASASCVQQKSLPTLASCHSSANQLESENVGVVMTCSPGCDPAPGHSAEVEGQDAVVCEQCSTYRSAVETSGVIECDARCEEPHRGPVTRKERILDMIEQLSDAPNCECHEEERPKIIQQLFRELTLMLSQEPECAKAPQDRPVQPTRNFEECCAIQQAGQDAIEPPRIESKKQQKRLECFAQLDEVLRKCFQKPKPPKSMPLTEIGGFEFDPDFRPFESHEDEIPPALDTEESQIEDEAEVGEHDSDVFVGCCDCEEDQLPPTLQEHITETESELCQQLMDIVGQPMAETEECGGLCEEELLQQELVVGPCPGDCPPADPCKMMEQYKESMLIPNGPLSPQARQLFELLLRQALRECEEGCHTGEEECEEESLQHGVPEPQPGPCVCCHCRALLCENECKTVTKTVDSAMCDPVCEMKYFIDSIIVDLHAMGQVLGMEKSKTKKCKTSRDLDKPPRESFPVTITNVSSLGCTALYIRWEVLDCTGIAGYEIYVDGHLTNRFYSFRHEAGVAANVDVTKTHQIVLRAHPIGQDFPGEGCGNESQALVCANPEMLVGAEKPWTPSVYFYDPS